MGVGVTCPNCRSTFAFFCSNCRSFETEIYESLELASYFQTRSLYYLKCRMCGSEFGHALCPDCHTRVIPEKPFVTGDKGGGSQKWCFIATACLDEDSPALRQLYVFRDEALAKNRLGRRCIRYYYACSPILAAGMHKSPFLKTVVKYALVYPAYFASRTAMRISAVLRKQPDTPG